MGYREGSVPVGSGLVCSWELAVPADAERFVQRVVPDGCVDLIWWSRDGRVMVAGPDTGPMPTPLEPGESLVGVRFAPGRAAPVLGVPADAVRDGRVPLTELWGSDAVRLGEAVSHVPGPPLDETGARVPGSRDGTDRQVEALVGAVAARGRAAGPAAGPVDPVVASVVRALTSGASVRDVADAVGLSERQLRRRALAAFGYGPKVLQRVLRFQGVLRAVRAGVPAADAAFGAGYADQAHMAHEVRELAGVPLGVLLGKNG